MPLPADYPSYSITDLRHRLRGGVIEYGGKPIFITDVKGVAGDKVLNAISLPDFNPFEIEVSDSNLNIKGLGRNLGLFNFEEDIPAYISRVPMRAMQQSINYNSIFISIYKNGIPICVNQSAYRNKMMPTCNLFDIIPFTSRVREIGDTYAIKYELVRFLHSPSFTLELFHGKYPNTYALLEERYPYSKAISRGYFIERDDFGDVYLCNTQGRIGKFSINKVRYLENKVYLSGDVERTLGLMPI